MLNSINNFNRVGNNSQNKSFKANGEVHVKDLYVNDMHGILTGFRKFKTVKDTFDRQNAQDPTVIGSTFISGDSSVGANRKKNEYIVAAQNIINPDAVTPGNHEFDDKGAKGFSELLNKAKYPTLALNLTTQPNSSLKDDIDAGRLLKSKIVEKGGQKFGLIGLTPHDLYNRVNQQCKDNSQDIDVLGIPETMKALQAEVDRMEKQGVNKITVVSHMGYPVDIAIAKNVNGVDIIHGAHTHDLIKGIEPGKNFFTSKRGEPVLITQASKNGHWYGISDVVYDKNGKIIKASNELQELDKQPDSLMMLTLENMMIGHPSKIAEFVNDAKSMQETVLDENPMCSFHCDAYKKATGAQIILLNTGTMRNTIAKGSVTDRQIIDMMPYYNDISSYKLSEKDLVGAINSGLEATKKYNRTGALQVAGMQYVIGKNGKVKEAYLLNDNGSKEKMNVENPRADKFFTVAYNTFLSGGTEGLGILCAPEKKIETFANINETDLLIDYLKSFNGKPITIEKQGRITLEQ